MTARAATIRAPRAAARLRPKAGAATQPVEYSLLLTSVLCLIALGCVMVFSSSSATSILGEEGDGFALLKRTLVYAAIGLLAMRFLSLHGLAIVHKLAPVLVLVAIGLLVAVLVPGVGVTVNGAQRWIGFGLFQVQPSEVAKVALIIYGAFLISRRSEAPELRDLTQPFLLVATIVLALIVVEPDLGTAIVTAFALFALLVAAGVPSRQLALLAAAVGLLVLVMIAIAPYRMERLTSFLDPSADATGAGFQSTQAKIAIGSGGIFGVGLGASVQKAFYLPEAHTDMIFAVIGEEWGLMGAFVVFGLFGLLGYAGLRAARNARDPFGKLLAAGLTSAILVQAIINVFAVMGLAPLTGVPLPFVSYGGSSLIVMLAAVGLMLNVARGATVATSRRGRRPAAGSKSRSAAKLRGREGGRPAGSSARAGSPAKRRERSGATRRDSRGRHGGTRRAGTGRRRRLAS